MSASRPRMSADYTAKCPILEVLRMWRVIMSRNFLLSSILVLCFGASTSYTQNRTSDLPAAVFPEMNERALQGVKKFDAIALISTWLKMDGDRERTQSNIQSSLELRLRRDGIAVEQSAPNYLICEAHFATASRIVVYSWSVEYFDFNTTGVHQLLSALVETTLHQKTSRKVARMHLRESGCGGILATKNLHPANCADIPRPVLPRHQGPACRRRHPPRHPVSPPTPILALAGH